MDTASPVLRDALLEEAVIVEEPNYWASEVEVQEAKETESVKKSIRDSAEKSVKDSKGRVQQQKHCEIAKGCLKNISSVVKVSSCYSPKAFCRIFFFKLLSLVTIRVSEFCHNLSF